MEVKERDFAASRGAWSRTLSLYTEPLDIGSWLAGDFRYRPPSLQSL